MSDITTKQPARTVPGISKFAAYHGWQLISVSTTWYQAVKGRERINVGVLRHGDVAELVARFHAKVDEHEAAARGMGYAAAES